MSSPIYLFTIGFTQKSAKQFFGLLQDNAVDVLVDTRLKPDSQLSGFAKKRDLPYLLKHLANCDYRHILEMAPSEEHLKQYRQDKSWADYESRFQQLISQRDLISSLDYDWWSSHRACLLCSEHEPDHCHRRLVAEYMKSHWPDITIKHLM